MKILFTLLFCVASITIGVGQSDQAKPAIMIGDVSVKDHDASARGLRSKTKTLLEKNYYVAKKAYFQLDIEATPGKAYTINGMDTYTTSDVQVNYTISLNGTKPESKTISVKCKGSTEIDMQRKIGSTILRNKAIRSEVTSFVDAYLAANLSSCSAVSTIIDQQIMEDEPALAYASLAYYNLVDGCSDISQKKETKILDAIAAKSCKSLLHDAEILANGATIRQLTQATNKLLLVGPDTPCQEEVLRISKLVAANAKELDAPSSSNIHVRLEQRQVQTRAEWREYYRKHYYRRN